MKVAFTTSGDDLDAPFESRFGRAPKFLVLRPGSGFLHGDRQPPDDERRAGRGDPGGGDHRPCRGRVSRYRALRPKAFRVLSAAGVRIFTASASTVGEALGLFRDGKLVESLSADVEGHWM